MHHIDVNTEHMTEKSINSFFPIYCDGKENRKSSHFQEIRRNVSEYYVAIYALGGLWFRVK